MPMIDGKDKSAAGRFGGAGIDVAMSLLLLRLLVTVRVGGARLRVGDPEGVIGGDVGIVGVCVGATD